MQVQKKWINIGGYKKENYVSWTSKEKGAYEYWLDIKYVDSPNKEDFQKKELQIYVYQYLFIIIL